MALSTGVNQGWSQGVRGCCARLPACPARTPCLLRRKPLRVRGDRWAQSFQSHAPQVIKACASLGAAAARGVTARVTSVT